VSAYYYHTDIVILMIMLKCRRTTHLHIPRFVQMGRASFALGHSVAAK